MKNKIKYTSDYTAYELADMGYIEEFIKPLVLILNDFNIKTCGSCEGHINNIGNCEYPWIDFHESDIHKIINLLHSYEDKCEILLQFRNDKLVFDDNINTVRIFPYCTSLKDGKNKFKKFENYLFHLK